MGHVVRPFKLLGKEVGRYKWHQSKPWSHEGFHGGVVRVTEAPERGRGLGAVYTMPVYGMLNHISS